MDKRETKLRLLDVLTAFVFCLVFSVLCYLPLYRLIGIWALYLGCALSVAVVILISEKTGLKVSVLFKFGAPKIREIFAVGLLVAGALLLSLPAVLIFQIVFPDFALSGFRVTAGLSDKGKLMYLFVALLILFSAFSESLLFDGYIFIRTKKIARLLVIAPLIGLSLALFRHDLYIFIPVFIFGSAAIYVRNRTGSMTLPLIMHIIFNTAAIAFTDAAITTEDLFGLQMGMLPVIGMGMILSGAALPVTVIGMRLLGDLKNRQLFEKAIVLVLSIVLIASGYAISRIA